MDETAGSPKMTIDEIAGSPKIAVDETAGSPKIAVDETAGSPKIAADETAGSPKIAMDETAKMMSKRKELEELLAAHKLDEERIGALLETLAATEVHLDVLKRTKIGKTVNDVRKKVRHMPVLSRKTAELILKWKKIATDEFLEEAKSRTSESPKRRSSLSTSSEADTTAADAQEGDRGDQESAQRPISRQKSSDSDHSNNSSDKEKDDAAVRLKSVEMIEDALCSHDSKLLVPTANPHEIAEQVEQFIFDEFKDSRNAHYRARVRCRVANLSDALNANLRELVLRGIIGAEKLATMTSEELANDKMRKVRRTITAEVKDDHLLPDPAELTHSTMFSCPECKERDCMYRNSIERQDGDSVEVTFLACNKCGNHWKSF